MEHVQGLQQTLERLASLQCELLGVLVSLGGEVSVSLQASLDHCADRQRRLRDMYGRLYESVHNQHCDWEQVAREASELQTTCSGHELEELLFAKTDTHTVTIESQSGHEWRAEGVRLQNSPVMKLAMLLMLQRGELHLQSSRPKASAFQKQMSLGDTVITATTENRTDHMNGTQNPNYKRVLSNLWCDNDPQWTLSVLEQNAPHVEELQLYDVGREHLRAVQHMPCLRKLQVWDWHGEQPLEPLESSARPAGALEWLEVRLPERTVQWLLEAHRHSLQELRLCVGLPRQDGKPSRWPSNSSDLHLLLGRIALPRLTTLVLLRSCLAEHCPDLCRAQLQACAAALPPSCAVLCSKCNKRQDDPKDAAAPASPATFAGRVSMQVLRYETVATNGSGNARQQGYREMMV